MAHVPGETRCNSCIIKDKDRTQKLNKGKKDMSKIDIVISCNDWEQKQIEEHCLNKGISYSDYFMTLHYNRPREEEPVKIEEQPKKTKSSKK